MTFKTVQEAVWSVNFGIEHTQRHQVAAQLASNLHAHFKALLDARNSKRCIEAGGLRPRLSPRLQRPAKGRTLVPDGNRLA